MDESRKNKERIWIDGKINTYLIDQTRLSQFEKNNNKMTMMQAAQFRYVLN